MPQPKPAAPAAEPEKLIFVIFGCKPARGDFWNALAGRDNGDKRKAVMRTLGYALPKSKCGYGVVMYHLFAAFPNEITGDCPSVREKSLFAAILKAAK